MTMATKRTYKFFKLADDDAVREYFPELIDAVHVWRKLGFTSFEVSIILKIPLKTINRLWILSTNEQHQVVLQIFSEEVI